MEKECQKILDRYSTEGGSVVSLLQDIQETFGFIREDVVEWFSEELNVPASNFFGVATFYAQFTSNPAGKILLLHAAVQHVM